MPGFTQKGIEESKPNLGRQSSDTTLTSSVSRTFANWKLQNAKSKTAPIVLFRRMARLAIMCFRLCKQSYESVEAAKNEFLSVVQVGKDMEASINKDGLYFDPCDFKANKERKLGLEAKRLLQLKQDRRTEKDLDYLQIALKRIRAFAEYPKRMQRKLVQVGWYEGYEPKRAIVRQGHKPHSFYFIISGTVVVTAYDKNAQASRTLVFLYQGMSFGELAVITRSVRQATVSSTTDVELLCISAQDFENVFMSGGTKNVNDPDHNFFIEGVGFLEHMPVQSLLQNPSACRFHYFDRGQVMVRDSNKSDWIYIVKSGSLSVLKKLLRVEPNFGREDSQVIEASTRSNDLVLDLHSDTALYERYGQKEYYAKRRSRKRIPTRENETDGDIMYRTTIDMEKRLAQTLPGFFNQSDRLGVINYEAVIDTHKARLVHRISTESIQLPMLEESGEKEKYPAQTAPENETNLPTITKTKDVYLSTSKRKAATKKNRQDKDLEMLALKQKEQAKEQQKNLAGRKTIADEFDNKPIPPDFQPTDVDLHPMFILIQILERGQYFGICQMIYGDQPSLSVVSNGAECIMISKKFFVENSKDYAMHYLRLTECPYPPDDHLQDGLQSYVNWQFHRSNIYRKLVDKYRTRAAKKKQYLPLTVGQYSFKTGPI